MVALALRKVIAFYEHIVLTMGKNCAIFKTCIKYWIVFVILYIQSQFSFLQGYKFGSVCVLLHADVRSSVLESFSQISEKLKEFSLKSQHFSAL